MNLSDRKIVFITGKGGVGKSTLSLAVAAREASKGRRVLLVELSGANFFSRLSGQSLDFAPKAVFAKWPNLHLAQWTGSESLEEYVLSVLKLKTLVHAFFDHPIMRSLIEAAPALSDVAILGKLTSGCRPVTPKLDYDLIVLDCFSTGHFLSMMKAPLGLAEAIRVGPMGRESRDIHEVLSNNEICSYLLCALPEELAVQETEELYDQLNDGWGVKPEIILNRRLPVVDVGESKGSFARFMKTRYESEEKILNRLREKTESIFSVHEEYELDAVKKVEHMISQLEEL